MLIIIDKLIKKDNPHTSTKFYLFENPTYTSLDDAIYDGVSDIATKIKIDKTLNKDKVYWLLPIAILQDGEEQPLPLIPVSLLTSINGDGKLYISSLSTIEYDKNTNRVKGKISVRNIPIGDFDVNVCIVATSPTGEKNIFSTQYSLDIDIELEEGDIPKYLTYYLLDKNDNSSSEVFKINISVNRDYSVYSLNDTNWLEDIDETKELTVTDVYANAIFSGIMTDFDYSNYLSPDETYYITYVDTNGNTRYLTSEVKDIAQFPIDLYRYNKQNVASKICSDFLQTGELSGTLLSGFYQDYERGWFISTGVDKAIAIYKTDSWQVKRSLISVKRDTVTSKTIQALASIDFDNVKYMHKYHNYIYIQEGNTVKKYDILNNTLATIDIPNITSGTIVIPISNNIFVLLGDRSLVEAYILDKNKTVYIAENPVDKQVSLEYLVYYVGDKTINITGYDGANTIEITQAI